MFRVDSRVRVYLEGVIVMGRILKQAVERVEHLVREQEEELSTHWLAMRKTPRRRDLIHTLTTHHNPNHPHHQT